MTCNITMFSIALLAAVIIHALVITNIMICMVELRVHSQMFTSKASEYSNIYYLRIHACLETVNKQLPLIQLCYL